MKDYGSARLIEALPSRLVTEYTGEGKDVEMSLRLMSKENIKSVVAESLRRKNAFASRRMLLYNAVMISPLLSCAYAAEKLRKGWR